MRSSLIILGLLAVIGVSVALIRYAPAPSPPAAQAPGQIPAEIPGQIEARFEAMPALGPPSPPDCRGSDRFAAAAGDNSASLQTLAWSPLGMPETGWETYAPLIGREIASLCPPSSTAFAEALARWQARHGLVPDGRVAEPTFMAMYRIWHARRPFARIDPANCPAPPPAADMAQAAPAESYGGKEIQLRRDALIALRRMAAAARAEDPRIAADPRLLTIVSGYRDPVADLARCAADGACDNRRRTWCSAHRTGTAADLYVGEAPGLGPVSTAPESRLYLSRTATYRWLVANAARFGFVNYVYEPWHWEWAGDPATPPAY